MKVHLSEINSLLKINKNFNFDDLLKDNNEIISIDNCLVTGTIEENHGEVIVDLKIEVKMILASSRSLKPIPYNLDFNLDLIFGNSDKADYMLERTIDLKEIVFAHILLEKPLTIYDTDEVEETKPKQKNPAFSALEDFKL